MSDTHFMIREPDTGRVIGMGTVTRDISEIKTRRKPSRQTNRWLQKTNEEGHAPVAEKLKSRTSSRRGSSPTSATSSARR